MKIKRTHNGLGAQTAPGPVAYGEAARLLAPSARPIILSRRALPRASEMNDNAPPLRLRLRRAALWAPMVVAAAFIAVLLLL